MAASHSPQAREEAARKLITNHEAVVKDVTHGNPTTQKELQRVPITSAAHVDRMLREVARRLLGKRPGAEQLVQQLQPSDAAMVAAWSGTAAYLVGRVQSKPEQMPGRKPDMSEAATAAFVAVLQEVGGGR